MDHTNINKRAILADEAEPQRAAVVNRADLDSLVKGYIDAALFSEPIGDEPSRAWAARHGEDPVPEDTSLESFGFTSDDIAPESMSAIRAHCLDFLATYGHEIPTNADMSAVGSDLWFTRNRHGVGFWDGRWPEPYASRLTEAARSYGECHVYLGDDDLLHYYPH